MATKKYYVDVDVRGRIDVKAVRLESQEVSIISNNPTVVASMDHASFDALIIDYVLKDGTTNLRAGTLHVVHNGTIIEHVDTSTHDIGNTDPVSFETQYNGQKLEVILDNAQGYYVNTFVRAL